LDEQALIEYMTQQRWYGAKSRAVMHARILDSVVLRTTEPQFALALVELGYDTGAHDMYQLLYALRDDEIELDGMDEPQLARELVSAMRSGLTLHGAEGIVEFRPVEGFAGLGRELSEARAVRAEQSNTSVVFDDELILKAFRRLEAGINPELEMLRFLTGQGFANIAALGGWYQYSGGPIGATLGVVRLVEALGGSADATDRVIKIMDRRARLLGLATLSQPRDSNNSARMHAVSCLPTVRRPGCGPVRHVKRRYSRGGDRPRRRVG